MKENGQQFMRIVLFFDLPVATKIGRRHYTRFHAFLLRDGYDMLQFSVYSRLCNGMDQSKKHLTRISQNLPPEGSIRTLCLTDKQFSRMQHWIGAPKLHERKVTSQQLILL